MAERIRERIRSAASVARARVRSLASLRMRDVSELGTILGVWAHPDDDIYLAAGLMAAAVDAGQRVVDVTATRGEGGSMDEERWPPESMGEVRTKELLRSLEVLGVQEHHFLEGSVDVDMDTGLDPRPPSRSATSWRRSTPTRC